MNIHNHKDKEWFPQGTFDNYVIKGCRLDLNTDLHGVFNECTDQLIGYIKVQSYPQLVDNQQYYHLQEIHIDTDCYGQGALSSLICFMLRNKNIKLYTDTSFIDTRDIIKKLSISKISSTPHNSKTLLSSSSLSNGIGYPSQPFPSNAIILHPMTLFRNELPYDPEVNIWD